MRRVNKQLQVIHVIHLRRQFSFAPGFLPGLKVLARMINNARKRMVTGAEKS
jgi:hypothetical protein